MSEILESLNTQIKQIREFGRRAYRYSEFVITQISQLEQATKYVFEREWNSSFQKYNEYKPYYLCSVNCGVFSKNDYKPKIFLYNLVELETDQVFLISQKWNWYITEYFGGECEHINYEYLNANSMIDIPGDDIRKFIENFNEKYYECNIETAFVELMSKEDIKSINDIKDRISLKLYFGEDIEILHIGDMDRYSTGAPFFIFKKDRKIKILYSKYISYDEKFLIEYPNFNDLELFFDKNYNNDNYNIDYKLKEIILENWKNK